MYRMYSNRSLSLSYFQEILFGGRGAFIGERLLLIRFYAIRIEAPGACIGEGASIGARTVGQNQTKKRHKNIILTGFSFFTLFHPND